MNCTVFDVAKYILEKMGRVSTWKLQKLCYYSQAWQLAWSNKPLFNEDFEAWANGPVCRELFNVHKGRYMIEATDILNGDSKHLNRDEAETVDIIIRDYGDMEPWDLRELTHEETPWRETRGDTPEGIPSEKVISKALIAEYYGSL